MHSENLCFVLHLSLKKLVILIYSTLKVAEVLQKKEAMSGGLHRTKCTVSMRDVNALCFHRPNHLLQAFADGLNYLLLYVLNSASTFMHICTNSTASLTAAVTCCMFPLDP